MTYSLPRVPKMRPFAFMIAARGVILVFSLLALVSIASAALDDAEGGSGAAAAFDFFDDAGSSGRLNDDSMMDSISMEARAEHEAMPMRSAPRMAKMMRSEASDMPRPPRSAGLRSSSLGASVLEEGGSSFDASKVEEMKVRTGRVAISTVVDVDVVADAVSLLIESIEGGFVESREANRGWRDEHGVRRGRSVSATLRVPVAAFKSVMARLAAGVAGTAADDVESVTESVRDVTAEYVDVAARHSTLEATRGQLLRLMRDANEVKDVLSVQRELSSVTQQLEARKATMNRLQQQAALSTVHLSIAQRAEPHAPPAVHKPRKWSPIRTYKRAFAWLLLRLRHAVDVLIFLSVVAVPLALFFALLGRRRRARLQALFCGQAPSAAASKETSPPPQL